MCYFIIYIRYTFVSNLVVSRFKKLMHICTIAVLRRAALELREKLILFSLRAIDCRTICSAHTYTSTYYGMLYTHPPEFHKILKTASKEEKMQQNSSVQWYYFSNIAYS